MAKQKSLKLGASRKPDGPVECLGQTFESEAARRAHFTELLRQKLREPGFRETPGFPQASDEDILRLSDPPYYTACPNPFLGDYVRVHSRPPVEGDDYHRDPFGVDVSVGKTDALYRAHSYHTKVPHLAIAPSILHYTEPGDLVLDGFCGSGMTGVAAQFCGSAPAAYRTELEVRWRKDGLGKPKWGARRAILSDLGPAATFIAANYNLPFDLDAFAREARRILDEVEAEIGWMYQTTHTDGKTKGRINYTVWSEVFTCPECAGEIVFTEEALDKKTKRVADSFPCPHCRAEVSKKGNLERAFETRKDPADGQIWKRVKFRAQLINYSVGKTVYEKVLDAADRAILDRIAALSLPGEVPTQPLPIEQMYHGSRLAPKGFTRVHHLFLPRQAQALALLWRKASAVKEPRTRHMMLWFVEQAIWGMSLLNRYKTIMHGKTSSSNVNQYLSGVYYVPSQHSEVSPWYNLENRLSRYKRLAFKHPHTVPQSVSITTSTCASIPLPDQSVDYIFTDPPFGENIYYADLNFLVESWHRVITNAEPEAIVDRAKKKALNDYQALMRACFEEYARVLKPGRWMTVVFSNSSNAVWRAIQEALGTAGFVVADVGTLDKQQGSYRQVTSTAVKQDLVISAYKPTADLSQRFQLDESKTEEDVWAFVREHLAHVPMPRLADDEIEIIGARTAHALFDRVVAFFVQREQAVPLSLPEFLERLPGKLVGPRDDMFFLPEQIDRYNRIRLKCDKLRQLELFVNDEQTALSWLRRQLERKPQTYQELHPHYTKAATSWAKHERAVELRDLLKENFLHYDGRGDIPPRLVGWLRQSNHWRVLLDTMGVKAGDPAPPTDTEMVKAARDRWYVPNPNQLMDLEKMRIKHLLQEFEGYRQSDKKIKRFRTEAVRAGFKRYFEERDYRAIVDVAAKLPDSVIQEDETLLMYFDVAQMRLGDDASLSLFS